MPQFNASDPLAIPQLFQHQFDIDDLIAALCAPTAQWLNTTNGSLSPTQPTAPSGYAFLIEPLPVSFLATLPSSPEWHTLAPAEQNTLLGHITVPTMAWVATQVTQPTPLGGWLRTRVKEAALDWLDANNILPPSMRHINRKVPASTPPGRVRIAS